jgi:carotenoid cleavage dioxygenase
MLIHGYQPFEPYVQLYVLAPDGTCSLAEPVEAPWAGMLHDFAISEHHVVFPLGPIVQDGEALMSGTPYGETLSWQPERGLKFGIRPRAAGGAVRWFDAPTPGYMFHPGNAYERDGKIYMDACTYTDGAGFLTALKSFRSGKVEPGYAANPFLYEFDLATGICRETKLDERGAEFPRCDDRLVGYENRWGYAALSQPGSRAGEPAYPWSRIIKYDRLGGASAVHDFGRWQWVNEPVFVPRTPTAEEDEGFVLTVVYDGTTDGTYLAVLDARNLAGAPLAKAHLEHRIPQGFHGNFVPA